MPYIKVKDNNHLLRNADSNCIVNTNKSEYEKYLKLREQKQNEVSKVENIERDISTLRQELDEIKSLLRELVNG